MLCAIENISNSAISHVNRIWLVCVYERNGKRMQMSFNFRQDKVENLFKVQVVSLVQSFCIIEINYSHGTYIRW